MKNHFSLFLFLFIILFTSCVAIPGYVDNNGNITPPYSSEIVIESISGTLSIIPTETAKGLQNINPVK